MLRHLALFAHEILKFSLKVLWIGKKKRTDRRIDVYRVAHTVAVLVKENSRLIMSRYLCKAIGQYI